MDTEIDGGIIVFAVDNYSNLTEYLQDNLDASAQAKFGVYHYIQYRCGSGHDSEIRASEKASHCIQIINLDVEAIKESLNRPHITLSDYLSHAPPRRSVGNSINGTTVLHRLPPVACSYEDCHSQSHIVGVRTIWPHILRILPEQNSANEDALASAVYIPQTISVQVDPALLGNNSTVIYQLVGSLRHQTDPEHWISRIGIDGSFFEYDDLKQSGRYTDLGNDVSVVEAPDRANVMFVYHLVSDEEVNIYSGYDACHI